ncbi:MAG: tetratricopeptide repeat protein [Candidatus Micrarchaeia archaeon]
MANEPMSDSELNRQALIMLKNGKTLFSEYEEMSADKKSEPEGILLLQNALTCFDVAVSYMGPSLETHQYRARILYGLGHFKDAADACNLALELEKDDSWTHSLRAFARMQMADYVGALEDVNFLLSKAGGSEGEKANLLKQAALCHSELGDIKKTRTTCDAILEIDKSGETKEEVARMLRRAGEQEFSVSIKVTRSGNKPEGRVPSVSVSNKTVRVNFRKP